MQSTSAVLGSTDDGRGSVTLDTKAKRPAAVLCQLLQRVVFGCLPLLFA
jgi:hypothetical protein